MRRAALLLCLTLASASAAAAMTVEASDAKFTAASERLVAGDPAGAVADLREVAEFWKQHFGEDKEEHALARAQLGVALMNSGQHAAAIPELETAVEIRADLFGATSPKVRGNRHNLARCLSAERRPADAAAQLRIVVLAYEEDPGTPAAQSISARVDLGAALRALGSHEEAIEAYLAALDIAKDVGTAEDPANGAAHWGVGLSAHELGRYPLALEHQQRARDLAAKEGNTQLVRLGHFNVGRALTELGRYAEALASFEEARAGEKTPATRAEVESWRARCLVELGVQEYDAAEYEAAVKHLGEANQIRSWLNAEELAPRAAILWKLGACERRLGKLEDARTHVDEAIDFLTRADGERAASLALPLEISAMILAEAKQIDEAKARARRASEIRDAKGDPWTLAVRAVVIDFAGEPKKAMQGLKLAARRAAKTRHPQYGTILSELASFLLRHGKTGAARKVEAKMRALKARR